MKLDRNCLENSAEWSKLTRRARWIFMVYWSNLHPLLRAGYLQLTCCLSYKLLPHYHSFLWNLAARHIELMLNNSEKKWKRIVSDPERRYLKFPAVSANENGLEGTTRTSFSHWTQSMGVTLFDFRQMEEKYLHLLRCPTVSLVQSGGRALWGCDTFQVFRLWEARNKILTLLTSTSILLGGQISRKTRLKPIPNTTGQEQRVLCACTPLKH